MALSVKRLVPDAIRRPLGQSRRYAGHPGLPAAQFWPVGEILAAAVPTLTPPILLVSLPRGGSSWAGRLLGSSDRSLYLHEPVTQSHLARLGGRGVSEFEMAACKRPRAYLRDAALALHGVPRFPESVVHFRDQWRPATRRRRRVVVKEVNPLALDALVDRFRPRVVYLLRHPAAVARSYKSLGWDGSQLFRSRFAPATLSALEREFTIPHDAGFWEQSGALQAIVQHRVMRVLGAWPDHTVVRFEDLCRNPVGGFARLFDFCGLPMTPDLEAEIERSSHADGPYRPGGSDTVRDSRAMAGRWKQEVDADSIAAVRRGYEANRPLFYRDEW